ncbi:uncharacterized protein UBRO_04195 [Ustilago bromivora]|uniref:Nudix hydrolase domain-containing protein n=1 Tax=Ustilago bromivora TaxID=307758 RepID=A0A1K0H6H9_9BASI|nr:uncharacterized protein UBRO_04195 [Ustilago bromivora]SYW75383.1 uncharacterized protein UBRO2_00618 [Ustilago bromivora]
MSQSGESFTLLESGTSRQHFKLAKALEDASTPRQRDIVIVETVAELRKQLASRALSSDVSKLTSALLTLLHCLQHYPASDTTLTVSPATLDVSFALIPALQLLGLATDWKHLLLAHQLLPYLLPLRAHTETDRRLAVNHLLESQVDDLDSKSQTSASASASTSSRPPSFIARSPPSHRYSDPASTRDNKDAQSSISQGSVDDSSSLLLLNTFRANLTAAVEQAEQDNERSDRQRSARLSSRSSSPTLSRSPSRIRLTKIPNHNASSFMIQFRASASLRSLAAGTPQGPAVLPSLASTLVALTKHSDSSIRSLTLNVMLACASFSSSDDADKEGQLEVLDAALTIVRLTLASTYAFSPGSGLDEQQGLILSEMERRVDSNPSVLRSCIRVIDHARAVGLITNAEAACHAVEALQASRWAPMHLDLPELQQQRIAPSVVTRTEGIRARKAAKQKETLQSDHDYHGTYAPWLVEACLSSLTKSLRDLLQSSTAVDTSTSVELTKTILRLYNVASQGKAAALALCVSAAMCIGALHSKGIDSSSPSDGETTALWSSASTQIMSQLHSINPNRKTAALMLLEALLPIGWAHVTDSEEREDQTPVRSPLQVSEEDMGQLMAFLADPDTSIRKRALTLLDRVDPSITRLLRGQLQSAVDAALSSGGGHSSLPVNESVGDPTLDLMQRLVEVAIFAVASSGFDGSSAQSSEAADSMTALEQAITSVTTYGIFEFFERNFALQETAWLERILISIRTLSLEARLDLLQRLTRGIGKMEDASHATTGLYLVCRLICDLDARDFRGEKDTDSFIRWVSSELLSSHGLPGTLVRLSMDRSEAIAAREAVLGVLARTISLVTQIVGSRRAASDLATGLGTLQSTLSKVVEAASPAALRTEAGNLQLICQNHLCLDSDLDGGLARRIFTLASKSHTIEDAVRVLLELHLESRSPENKSERGNFDSSHISTGSSILATASQLFAPTIGTAKRPTDTKHTFADLRSQHQLPDSVLQSSRLLSPDDSTATLRSSKHDSRSPTGKPRERRSHRDIDHQQASAISSESKRIRDRNIAAAMSDSIANLVLGSNARAQSSDNEVTFSATSSGVLEDEELELVNEVADSERRLDAAAETGQKPSLLDLVHQCHNHEPWLDMSLTPFVLDGVQIGFLPARVVKACVEDSEKQRQAGAPAVLRKVHFAMHHREIVPPTTATRVCEAITFTPEFSNPERRTAGLNAVAQRWREASIFPDPLDGWRNELYAIYGLNPRPGSRNTIAFKLERSACALFGFATFGVHLTAYTVSPGTGELKVWVPQRSSTKSTWPGYLDNSVAGGIVAGDLPMESMVRECEEEANLESTLVEKHIKQTGVLSYCYKTAKQGWMQPEVEYVYDLPLPSDVTLQPKDGEVDHFELMTLDEIYNKMRQGKFKANCVLVLLDFLIRHGHITAENEPSYRQIVAQLHVDLRLPGP